MPSRANQPLATAEKILVVLFLILLVALGGLVELRSVYQHRRKTDADVYFTAAWAVRAGVDPYEVTDSNGWHYWYPPPLAVLLAPMADAPPGGTAVAALSYPLSVALWYVLSLLGAGLGVHLLASALEATSPDPAVHAAPRYCRRWWALRIWPVVVCLPALIWALTRGQVAPLLLLLLAGATAAILRAQRFRAGLWLAGAICLKMIPVLLVLVPLVRRDWRTLGGVIAGLALGLGVIPLSALGPMRTVEVYRSFTRHVLMPSLPGGDAAAPINEELVTVTPTDSNSPWLVFHNWLHPLGATRPAKAGAGVHAAHWLLAAALIVVTLLGLTGKSHHPWREALVLAALAMVMIVVSPVFHPHYFAIGPLLVIPLLAYGWETRGSTRPPAGWLVLGGLLVITYIIPGIKAIEPARNMGFPLLSTLALWALAIGTIWKMCRVASTVVAQP